MIKTAKLVGGALDGVILSISRKQRHVDAYFRLEMEVGDDEYMDSHLDRYEFSGIENGVLLYDLVRKFQ